MGVVTSSQRARLEKQVEEQAYVFDVGFCGAEPITKLGKRLQLGQLFVAVLVPAVFLAAIVGMDIDKNFSLHEHSHIIHEELSLVRSSKAVLDNFDQHCLTHPESMSFLNVELIKINLDWTWNTMEGLSNEVLNTAYKKLRQLSEMDITSMSNDTCEWMYRDTLFLEQILLDMSSQMQDNKSMMQTVILRYILYLRIAFINQFLLGERFFEKGLKTAVNHVAYLRNAASIKAFLDYCNLHSEQFKVQYHQISDENQELEREFALLKQIIHGNHDQNSSPPANASDTWRKVNAYRLNTLSIVSETITNATLNTLSHTIYTDKRYETLVTLGLVACLVVLLVLLLIIYLVTRQCQQYVVEATIQTKQLRREKKTSDSLLYQMLPKSVALQIKMNRKVAAESYSAVTIYFSDIVGFTAISSHSTPMQVVALLNQLYLLFDTTIERYDVYKVETIGDAYMVTSGVPQRNGKRHSGEIATFSLDLLQGVRVFQIPHMPEECLRIRIGLHTGPVVAGIVGVRMPRYCLFGDTVAIASAMESTGVPMRIQLTSTCKDALQKLGGYITEKRGGITIKSQELETFFLLEKIPSRTASLVESNI